jgi:hypothetical protein
MFIFKIALVPIDTKSKDFIHAHSQGSIYCPSGSFPGVLLFLKCLAGGIAMLMYRIRFKLKDLPLIMLKEMGEI